MKGSRARIAYEQMSGRGIRPNDPGWRELQRMDARREMKARALMIGACLAALLILSLSGCSGSGADALAFAGAALTWTLAGVVAGVAVAVAYGLIQLFRGRL